MRKCSLRTVIMAFGFSAISPAFAQAPAVTTVASYPHGAFLENLSVDPKGRLLFTSYFDRTVLVWDGTNAPKALIKLDVHPVAVLARSNDIVVSAHGQPFNGGPAFTSTNRLLVLGRDGTVKSDVAAPNALFLNGMVEVRSNAVLVADSIAGKIWQFNPTSGRIDIWLADPLLAADPAKPSSLPAANGLKVRAGWLYVSNSSRATLHRIRLLNGKPKGALELFATTGAIDDFTFLADGTIAAATHGKKLIRVGKDGAVTDILSDGCDACTSVATYGPRADLIVLTTGNLFEGRNAPARVLRIASPLQSGSKRVP